MVTLEAVVSLSSSPPFLNTRMVAEASAAFIFSKAAFCALPQMNGTFLHNRFDRGQDVSAKCRIKLLSNYRGQETLAQLQGRRGRGTSRLLQGALAAGGHWWQRCDAPDRTTQVLKNVFLLLLADRLALQRRDRAF